MKKLERVQQTTAVNVDLMILSELKKDQNLTRRTCSMTEILGKMQASLDYLRQSASFNQAMVQLLEKKDHWLHNDGYCVYACEISKLVFRLIVTPKFQFQIELAVSISGRVINILDTEYAEEIYLYFQQLTGTTNLLRFFLKIFQACSQIEITEETLKKDHQINGTINFMAISYDNDIVNRYVGTMAQIEYLLQREQFGANSYLFNLNDGEKEIREFVASHPDDINIFVFDIPLYVPFASMMNMIYLDTKDLRLPILIKRHLKDELLDSLDKELLQSVSLNDIIESLRFGKFEELFLQLVNGPLE